jgi:RNase P subunit RPR2
LETINILEKLSVMFVTPGRTKQPGEFMSGRGELPCTRCKEVKRRDKLVEVKLPGKLPGYFCKHCRSVLVSKLRLLEEMAYLSE